MSSEENKIGLGEDSAGSLDNAVDTENEKKDNEGNGETEIDMNRYATIKTIAEGMLDICLLSANASQLKSVLQAGKRANQYYTLMIILLSISIFLQVTIGICLVFIGTLNISKPKKQKKANILNNAITIQILLLTAINIVISSFGSLSNSDDDDDDDDDA